jgi:hypothetical protein
MLPARQHDPAERYAVHAGNYVADYDKSILSSIPLGSDIIRAKAGSPLIVIATALACRRARSCQGMAWQGRSMPQGWVTANLVQILRASTSAIRRSGRRNGL